MREQIKRFFSYNWFATIRINFRLLPFSQARKFPILACGRMTTSFGPNAQMTLQADRITSGMLVLGSRHEMLNARRGETLFTLNGHWIAQPGFHLGVGSGLYVAKGATLVTGKDSYIASNSRIECFENIRLGDNLLAGEIYITDTSAHPVMHQGKTEPMTKPIEVGEGCYFGFRTMVLRGCRIPPRCVIASGAICTRQYTEPESLLAGVPAEVKERNVKAKTIL